MRRHPKPGSLVMYRGLVASTAFPWLLGGPLPELPEGRVYLTDDYGNYILDDSGNYLTAEYRNGD